MLHILSWMIAFARPTRRDPATTNKRALYDSYIRAIRWASDRIGDAGVIAFVSNAGLDRRQRQPTGFAMPSR